MPDDQTTTEVTDPAVIAPTEAYQPPAEATDETTENGGNEAAKYRRKLRAAEGERDQLAQQLEAMRRAEVERIAGGHVTTPASLWAAGVQITDLLDDAGQVDPTKVQTATQQAAETLGLARPRPNNYVAREGGNVRVRPQADMAAVVRGSDAF